MSLIFVRKVDEKQLVINPSTGKDLLPVGQVVTDEPYWRERETAGIIKIGQDEEVVVPEVPETADTLLLKKKHINRK
jgi:hypothetical protein